MRRAPSTLGYAVGGVFTMGFLVVFCIIAGAMMLGFSRSGAGPISIVPCLIFVVGLCTLATCGVRMARFHGASLQRKLARVLDERSEHSGDENSSTTHYATLGWEDRRRIELRLKGSLAGKITRDDIGLAYVKGDVLLDFERLDV
jgi:hypothetical protein